MLHQNWFYDKKFIMVDDIATIQVFYDTESKCFYKVEENEDNTISILEINEENATLYAEYADCYKVEIEKGGIN